MAGPGRRELSRARTGGGGLAQGCPARRRGPGPRGSRARPVRLARAGAAARRRRRIAECGARTPRARRWSTARVLGGRSAGSGRSQPAPDRHQRAPRPSLGPGPAGRRQPPNRRRSKPGRAICGHVGLARVGHVWSPGIRPRLGLGASAATGSEPRPPGLDGLSHPGSGSSGVTGSGGPTVTSPAGSPTPTAGVGRSAVRTTRVPHPEDSRVTVPRTSSPSQATAVSGSSW